MPWVARVSLWWLSQPDERGGAYISLSSRATPLPAHPSRRTPSPPLRCTLQQLRPYHAAIASAEQPPAGGRRRVFSKSETSLGEGGAGRGRRLPGRIPLQRRRRARHTRSLRRLPFVPSRFPSRRPMQNHFLRNRQLSSGQGGALLSFPLAACVIFTSEEERSRTLARVPVASGGVCRPLNPKPPYAATPPSAEQPPAGGRRR